MTFDSSFGGVVGKNVLKRLGMLGGEMAVF